MELLTFGHGTATADDIVRLLRDAEVRRLVDVRTAPGSRRHPHVARAAMERWLPDAGIDYRWDKRLGGWRKAEPDSPDTALHNRAFGGYAGHMRSADFLAGVDELLAEASAARTVVMCAEAVWWRCHRKLIADFVAVARRWDVRHLMPDGSLRDHRPSAEARLTADGLLVYDAGQEPLDVEPPGVSRP